MKYRREWKGRLRLLDGRKVMWDDRLLGLVVSERQDGAKSPGGMITNMVWKAFNDSAYKFASMTLAIDFMIQVRQLPPEERQWQYNRLQEPTQRSE